MEKQTGELALTCSPVFPVILGLRFCHHIWPRGTVLMAKFWSGWPVQLIVLDGPMIVTYEINWHLPVTYFHWESGE